MKKQLKQPKGPKQLNALLFDGQEKQLRRVLYNQLKSRFKDKDKLRAVIESECHRRQLAYKKIDGMCDGCKEPYCCTVSPFVQLTFEDIKRIESHGHRNFYTIVNSKYAWSDRFVIKKSAPCQFLKNNLCTIYDYRPEVCAGYPFVTDPYTKKTDCVLSMDCMVMYNILKNQVIEAMGD